MDVFHVNVIHINVFHITDTSSRVNGSQRGDIGELPDDVVTSLAALFGSLFGLLLVAVVVMVYRRQRASVLRVKKVYLLYTDDHKDHSEVINKLAIYLRDYCYCEVFYLPWFRGKIQTTGAYQWILSHIDQADYVLLISSEAAFMLFDARNTTTSFRTMDGGPEGDTFSPAVTHIMARSSQPDFHKKTILAYFEYTDEEYVIKEIIPGVNYQLPKYFKELLCHIHEVELCGKTPKQAKINAMGNLQASQCGRRLLDAVIKATHFQKACPQWFSERFQRQDSAYSSQYDHVGDSVSRTGFYQVGTDRVDANHNNYDDDEMRSTVTYNTTYARAHEMFPPSEVPTDTPTEFIHRQLQNITMQSMGMQNTYTQNGHIQDMENGHIQDMENGHIQDMENGHIQDMENGHIQNTYTQNGHIQDMDMENGHIRDIDMENGHIQDMENGHIQEKDMENGHIQDIDMENGHIQDMDMENGHIQDMENGHIQDKDMENGHIQDKDMENGHIQDMENGHIQDMENGHIQDKDMENGHIQDKDMENGHIQDMENGHIQDKDMPNIDMQNVLMLKDSMNISGAVHTHRHSPQDDVFTPPSDVEADEDVDVDVDVDDDFLAISVGCSSSGQG
ncbi:uncharacterized protein LOC124260177 isoform X2 [Haliotis rubra]|nr:uncharacterized protein LOC124260177 isoform X2 [Haliotis rubra]